MSGLKDWRFCRDAIGIAGWRGKLCIVNTKGELIKDGVVYDANNNIWEVMWEGMIRGWKESVAAMDEDEMFVVDEVKGAQKKYDA